MKQILINLTASICSHLRFQEKVLKTLLDRGHTVTALVEGTLKHHENLTQYNLNCGQEILAIDNIKTTEKGGLLINSLLPVMKQQLAHLEVEIVKKMIEEGNKTSFDLLISEPFSYNTLNQFAELYDCPIVISTPVDGSSHIHYALGNEINPNMVSDSIVFSYDTENMTL